MKQTFRFTNSSVELYHDETFYSLPDIVDRKKTILITDENVFRLHPRKFESWRTIVTRPGENNKTQATVDEVIRQLIELEADRSFTLVGVGGGVITDLTGYVASIYMRGIDFGFVPTTLLAMVDASIGGKNGIDIGVYKNMVGTIRQPLFIFYDAELLNTLPEAEWRNGFAEIIKHASIRDKKMFIDLEENNPLYYQQKPKKTARLVLENALLKTRVVQDDEFENGSRRILNFGHTLGHALENQYHLAHGEAISIGMARACYISESITGFKGRDRVISLLEKYGLPTTMQYDRENVMNILKMDKKKNKDGINYILLKKIGKAVVKQISVEEISQHI